MNREWSAGRMVETVEPQGLSRWKLIHASGAQVEGYRHGAHIVSWRDAGGNEQLFLSPQSYFQADRPIRGGIPLVFPQFGDGPLPKHGFARILPWVPVDGSETESGALALTLRLTDSPATAAHGAPPFSTDLTVELAAETLTLAWSIVHRGARPWRVACAFHTYFRVAEIGRTAVEGLQGVTLIDSLRDDRREVEPRRQIRFAEEVDRVYVAAPDRLAVCDEAEGRRVEIEKTEMADAVVWNPWIAKSKRLEDFGDEDYRRMVCVETGNIEAGVTLAPGVVWRGTTRFSVRRAV